MNRATDVDPQSDSDEYAPKVPTWRFVLFGAIVLSQFAMPFVLVLIGVSGKWPDHRGLEAFLAFRITLWAVFSIWVALDAASLCSFVELHPDPLGPKALALSLLGIANVVSALLFLMLAGRT